ncbi:hypothetical protein [Nocardia sputorum]|uniref:DUF1353 domain-containing protein n=1 Tax=Nocardia sputorum TaxID=2984338 RepID=A0ABN6UEI7_9NOCA|nr:hypothetical protein [Nocardia sputorum]BDU03350.1 hypothetical protein IFM12276_63780 [Nocardia sputorum]
MPYTKQHPPVPAADELRARIPGWGVDLDPKDRPSVPKLVYDPGATGAHWEFPDRQLENVPRERSIEHKFLTPVFGTSTPLQGLSGVIRRFAYKKYSEARTAHWLLLIVGDRVDVAENRVRSLLAGKPDNLITETGIKAEFTHHGLRSRITGSRVDRTHMWMDPLLVAAPWIASGIAGAAAWRALQRRRTR